jgi:hypothetical protein
MFASDAWEIYVRHTVQPPSYPSQLECFPDPPLLLLLLSAVTICAELFHDRGENELALQFLAKALRTDLPEVQRDTRPVTCAITHKVHGLVLAAMGRETEAEAAFEQVGLMLALLNACLRLPALALLHACVRCSLPLPLPPTATAQAATLAGRHGLKLLELLILKDLHDKVLVRRRPEDFGLPHSEDAARGLRHMQGVMKEGVNGGTKELFDTILGAELAAKLC